MTDYIKREDAIKAMARGLGIPYTDFIEVAERCMDDIQNADVVEVVRCKDCKHFEYDHWSKPDDNGVSIIIAHEICNFWNGGCKTSEDGYCSYGERRDNE